MMGIMKGLVCLVFFLLELCIEIPRETYLYLRNKHRVAVSDKLKEAMGDEEKEILVCIESGGYDWDISKKLKRALNNIGVTRTRDVVKPNGKRAIIANLTPLQINIMAKKRWVTLMNTADEMSKLKEYRLRDDLNTYKQFSQDQFEEALKQLKEEYQL